MDGAGFFIIPILAGVASIIVVLAMSRSSSGFTGALIPDQAKGGQGVLLHGGRNNVDTAPSDYADAEKAGIVVPEPVHRRTADFRSITTDELRGAIDRYATVAPAWGMNSNSAVKGPVSKFTYLNAAGTDHGLSHVGGTGTFRLEADPVFTKQIHIIVEASLPEVDTTYDLLVPQDTACRSCTCAGLADCACAPPGCPAYHVLVNGSKLGDMRRTRDGVWRYDGRFPYSEGLLGVERVTIVMSPSQPILEGRL